MKREVPIPVPIEFNAFHVIQVRPLPKSPGTNTEKKRDTRNRRSMDKQSFFAFTRAWQRFGREAQESWSNARTSAKGNPPTPSTESEPLCIPPVRSNTVNSPTLAMDPTQKEMTKDLKCKAGWMLNQGSQCARVPKTHTDNGWYKTEPTPRDPRGRHPWTKRKKERKQWQDERKENDTNKRTDQKTI